MGGFLFYKLQAQGFLHWGYNHWEGMAQEQYLNPFFETDCADLTLPPGDGYVVYPGPNGKVIDSMRWEVLAESLQDYAILQTAGIKPEDPMLAEIKTYADFPKTEAWLRKTLELILTMPQAVQK